MDTFLNGAFNSLYELIMSIPEDVGQWTIEQQNELNRKLREYGKEAYERQKQFENMFKLIREKNDESEDIVQQLHEILDRQSKTMLTGDMDTYRSFCNSEYCPYWDDLDENSQEFLITAHFLFDRSRARSTDFSPVILEFCRVFENELLEKIFINYITGQAALNPTPSYSKNIFSKVDKAINDQKNNGRFFCHLWIW